jgi:hypothetical protein
MRLAIILSCFLLLTGCGVLEGMWDGANYESVTSETGTINYYSGGKLVEQFKNATVLYANSDSQAMYIEDKRGKEIYLQGDVVMKID